MNMFRWKSALAVVAAAVAQEEPAQDAARFRVTEEVVSPGFGPFTATVAAMGAGSRLVWAGSGFEPATLWACTPPSVVFGQARPGPGAQAPARAGADALPRARQPRLAAGDTLRAGGRDCAGHTRD